MPQARPAAIDQPDAVTPVAEVCAPAASRRSTPAASRFETGEAVARGLRGGLYRPACSRKSSSASHPTERLGSAQSVVQWSALPGRAERSLSEEVEPEHVPPDQIEVPRRCGVGRLAEQLIDELGLVRFELTLDVVEVRAAGRTAELSGASS